MTKKHKTCTTDEGKSCRATNAPQSHSVLVHRAEGQTQHTSRPVKKPSVQAGSDSLYLRGHIHDFTHEDQTSPQLNKKLQLLPTVTVLKFNNITALAAMNYVLLFLAVPENIQFCVVLEALSLA